MKILLIVSSIVTFSMEIYALKIEDEPCSTYSKFSLPDGISEGVEASINVSLPDDISQEERARRLAAFEATISSDPVLPEDFVLLEEDDLDGVWFEDMLLTPEQHGYITNITKDRARKLVNIRLRPSMRWTDGGDGWPEIPYKMLNLPSSLQKIVENAVRYWHKYTCVKFKPATNINKPYVGIKLFGGCASRVGCVRRAGQLLGLATSCSLGNVIHELGHTLGFFHEHQRYDRRDYIDVNNHNVMDKCGGRLRGCDPNFQEKSKNDMFSFNVKYDLSSIMHYGPKMFTKSSGGFTLTAKDGELTGLLGQRSRLSHRDIYLINLAYKCTAKWQALCGFEGDPCMNEGYTGPDCKCICPKGTSGNLCQHRVGDYYDYLMPPCNRRISSPTTISATHEDLYKLPGDVSSPAAWCVFTIEAPPCQLPEITIKRFHIPDMYWRTKVKCKYAWVEFKEHYQTNGQMYCGTGLKYGQIIKGTSRTMFIFFNIGAGLRGYFEADVTFKTEELCDVMMDEALLASPFSEPIKTGSCALEMESQGYVWKTNSKLEPSDHCTLSFTNEPEPFGLRIHLGDGSWKSKDNICRHYVRYCYHEQHCAKLEVSNMFAVLPTSSAVFEYVSEDPSCPFELHINPFQSYCHKVLTVDSDNPQEIFVVDKEHSTCLLACKTPENRRVRIQMNIYRNILCSSEEEWIEVSASITDTKRKYPCVKRKVAETNIENSTGYWHSFESDENMLMIGMRYDASQNQPIIVTCAVSDWNTLHR